MQPCQRFLQAGVAIRGDQLDDYLQALEVEEKAKAPFRQYMNTLNAEFASYLAAKYVNKTVNKHTGIVDMFVEFICRHTDVEQVEEITRGMVNSHFRSWYKKKVWDSATDNDLRVARAKVFPVPCHRKRDNQPESLGRSEVEGVAGSGSG